MWVSGPRCANVRAPCFAASGPIRGLERARNRLLTLSCHAPQRPPAWFGAAPKRESGRGCAPLPAPFLRPLSGGRRGSRAGPGASGQRRALRRAAGRVRRAGRTPCPANAIRGVQGVADPLAVGPGRRASLAAGGVCPAPGQRTGRFGKTLRPGWRAAERRARALRQWRAYDRATGEIHTFGGADDDGGVSQETFPPTTRASPAAAMRAGRDGAAVPFPRGYPGNTFCGSGKGARRRHEWGNPSRPEPVLTDGVPGGAGAPASPMRCAGRFDRPAS